MALESREPAYCVHRGVCEFDGTLRRLFWVPAMKMDHRVKYVLCVAAATVLAMVLAFLLQLPVHKGGGRPMGSPPRCRAGRSNPQCVAGDGVFARKIQAARVGGVLGWRSGPAPLKTRFLGVVSCVCEIWRSELAPVKTRFWG